MNAETHSQLANFIWSICNLLRGPYKRNECRKVILPLTVLRVGDSLLAPTKGQVLKEHAAIKVKPEKVVAKSLTDKLQRIRDIRVDGFEVAHVDSGELCVVC
jgi:type I restriction enzyme M protein